MSPLTLLYLYLTFTRYCTLFTKIMEEKQHFVLPHITHLAVPDLALPCLDLRLTLHKAPSIRYFLFYFKTFPIFFHC